jgi:hypothetical protein
MLIGPGARGLLAASPDIEGSLVLTVVKQSGKGAIPTAAAMMQRAVRRSNQTEPFRNSQ